MVKFNFNFTSEETIAEKIDRLGQLKAQLADLEKQEATLKKEITELAGNNPGTFEGGLFKLTISVSERNSLDMDAVREFLPTKFIEANTKTTKVTTVRVSSR